MLSSLLVLASVGTAHAADRFVSTTGTDTANDCLSSAAPCATLGRALTQAVSGDAVKVAAGRYAEGLRIDFSTTLTFSGGWTADFGSRDSTVNLTTIQNTESVAFNLQADSGQTIDVTLDGFVIVGGRRPSPFGSVQVGGIEARAFADGSLTLALVSSSLVKNGEGLTTSAAGSSSLDVSLTGCSFTHNYASFSVDVRGSAAATVTVNDSTFAKNRSGGIGAIAYDTSTVNVAITNTAITNNADGGLSVTKFPDAAATMHVTLTDTLVAKNKTGDWGGGIAAVCPTVDEPGELTLSLVASTVTGNKARFDGGGIFVSSGSSASCRMSLTNSVVAKNKAGGLGGGIAGSASANSVGTGVLTIDLTNATIVRNRSSHGGGGMDVAIESLQVPGSSLTANLTNTILFLNKAPRGAVSGGGDLRMDQGNGTLTVNADHDDTGDRLTLSGAFNDLGGNISTDPRLVSGKDPHLRSVSPGIDAGTCMGAPATDIDGDPRPSGVGCDIGADEFVP